MFLRTLEDKRKFEFHRMSLEDRIRVARLLAKALSERKEVLLAVVFGGFAKSEVFRDVDVAIFTGYTIPYNKVELYEEEISRKLEEIVELPVDVRILDYAPSWFRVRALEGMILVERKPALAARLRFKAIQEIEDVKTKARKP